LEKNSFEKFKLILNKNFNDWDLQMIKDYFLLSFKNLKRRGIRSWLTLLGILIGISAVVGLISLGTGLQMAINSQFGISSTEIISVQAGGLNAYGPPGSGAVDPLREDDANAIERLSSVDKAFSRILPFGKIEFKDEVGFGNAISVPSGEDRKFTYEILDIEATAGRMLKDGDDNKVMLGYNFYTEEAGFGKKIRPGNKILVNDRQFEVVGILKKEGSFIFDNIIYMNEQPLRDLMDYGDKVDIIAVQVKNPDEMDRAKEDIEKLLRKRRNVKKGEENFEVSTPEAAMETVNGILGGVQAFIVLIASISILVGAIGIVNTMTTSVLERKREIGIMKSIGAKNSDIFLQFFIEAGLLGLIGGLVGVIIGVNIGIFGTLGINNFIGASTTPTVSIPLVLGSLFGSFLIGSISGIAPAMKAAKQHPVEALRD
jgi:putative ABC transport system permease protein